MSFIKVRYRPSSNRRAVKEDKIWWCPACKKKHKALKNWKLSGSLRKPTLTPDFNIKVVVMNDPGNLEDWDKVTCHSTIKEGMIYYHEDCGHKYAGKVIPMVDLDDVNDDGEVIVSKGKNIPMHGQFGLGIKGKQGLIDARSKEVM